jgi:hypothetical protein
MNEEKLKRRWLKEDEFSIDSAIGQAVENAEGRKFLWWLLEIGRVGLQPYATNALNTAFNCGEMNVGQRILDRIISVSPEGYLQMMKENNDERKEREAEIAMDDQADES